DWDSVTGPLGAALQALAEWNREYSHTSGPSLSRPCPPLGGCEDAGRDMGGHGPALGQCPVRHRNQKEKGIPMAVTQDKYCPKCRKTVRMTRCEVRDGKGGGQMSQCRK